MPIRRAGRSASIPGVAAACLIGFAVKKRTREGPGMTRFKFQFSSPSGPAHPRLHHFSYGK